MKTGFRTLIALCVALGSGMPVVENGQMVHAQDQAPTQLYVAKNGSDTFEGTMSRPFATLEKARDAIREMKNAGALPPGGVKVTIRGGEYRFTDTFQLDERDSGTLDSPITYEAYQGEKVTISGGDTIDASMFRPVSDPSILGRLPKEAGSKVMQLDLKALGITDYGVLGSTSNVPPELFINGNVMTLARWPNSGFTTVDQVVKTPDTAAGTGYTFTYKDNGLHKWQSIDYTWMLGYWGNDWATNDLQIKSIDSERTTIETYKGTSYAMKAGQRFYFYNILEELDAPGEWYVDRNTGMLYLYPPAPLQESKIQLSLFNKNLITMNNTSNVIFSHLAMEVHRGNAFDITGGENNRIQYCEISKMGGYAVKINGGRNNGVYGSSIYSMGNGGVLLNGGDFTTLTPAGNYADNNDIYNYARIKLTYTSAVELNGVGNRATHNKMHNAPHLAIQFRGNDHVMEYNEIYDVVKETADASAIYSGRSFVWRGNVINNNYFHDIIASDLRVSTAAIYLDDYMSGVEMRGNVFYKIGKQAFKLANGRENVVENNLVIDTGSSIAFMTRGYKPGEKNYESLMSKFDQVPYQSDIWAQRYPTLPDILNDEPLLPKRNVVRNNAFVNSGPITGDSQNMKLGTFENNLSFANKDDIGFEDAANGNFQLRNDSVIFSSIPEFKSIPFHEMGVKAAGLPPSQSGLSVKSVDYQQNGDDVKVQMSLNGNSLAAVKDESGLRLREGTDYVTEGSSVRLNKSYLASLAQGYHALTFSFSAGNDAFLNVNVLPPASAQLSSSSLKYAQNSGDSTIGMSLNGNTLLSINDGSKVLKEGTDYINNGTSVTFKSSYLMKLALGQYSLRFTFSSGTEAVLALNVVQESYTLNKTYSASSQWSNDYSAAKAFDGNPASRWSAEKGKTANQHLTVDFGDSITFNQVIVRESSYQRVNHYVLQYSEDGENYIDIPGTEGSSIGTSKTIDFDPVTAQYLRLLMYSTKLESGASKEPTINEVEVYYVPPVNPIELTVPGDLTVEAVGERTKVDIGTATSTEGVGVTNDAPSDFPLGTTVVTWTAKDAEGRTRTATQKVTVVDTVPPVITGEGAPQPNLNGWYRTPVTVHFTAVDSGSGVASVTPDIVLSNDGRDQTATGTAVDKAGNTATAAVYGIHIDTVKPMIDIKAAPSYTTSQTMTVAYSVYDDLSGVDSVKALLNGRPVVNGQVVRLADLAGANTLTVTASDKAGNITEQTVSLQVVIDAAVTMTPKTLNLKSQGGANSMTAGIALPQGYAASQLDTGSIRLTVNGKVIPAQAMPQGAGGTGSSLTVKFDRQQVIAALGTAEGNVTLTVSGSLLDGKSFAGSDTIRVIH
ncbi:X2-like carbohydrate binding domain-containing protein [Paenibacillus sp. 32352]|uniref:X2-like carbohydrate binding domain-containing protein n=1 Tax=Paenibacillus sp. 32352 TaxID=1969111 RepID=UPI0015C416E4|nr:X2-like carbohydrate binding domain-containing protein [Paenibacillus sp. 32352]